ncbi:bifunctional nuclease family protein [Ruicaihuangia caeni]|uniref:Bifunctional nuclease family protein n=1 Tax=Ruicaihuangia caeni TaxID=3042517 RepID=A0AAW6T2Y8_9MICO|nr:bifunctional nuclease family protein [Klugiella sp. YN-L-19]MDI2097799.1 bifunctional nuclease family protein [Klugiella sp. YN-L-19]
MVQVRVVGVAVDVNAQPVVLLQPLTSVDDEERFLPIWIGAQEATSIVIAAQGAEAPRPLSHDLMKSMLDALDASVEQVEVTRIDAGTFYAEVTLEGPAGRQILDARPSDAIGLALRTGALIWVADEVFEEASIPADAARVESEEEKLAEFKQFLEDVDPEDFQG